MKDIVFPKNNENEFFELGKKLGTEKFVFVYEFDYFLKNKQKLRFDNAEIGLLVNKKNIFKAKNHSKNLFVKAEAESRLYFEDKSRKTIFDLELLKKDDFMHHRNSGLNQVLCRLAKKNNVVVGFSFSSVLNADGYERAKIVGRMMQNIKLCRKYKVEAMIASFASKPEEIRNLNDLASFYRLLSQNRN